MAKALRVNGDRLWSRLMQMAEIGATPHGGCNRQALTDADMAGRRLLSRWAEEAGCRVRVDAVAAKHISAVVGGILRGVDAVADHMHPVGRHGRVGGQNIGPHPGRDRDDGSRRFHRRPLAPA